MYKKILSFVLAVLMVASLGVVGVFAAEETTTPVETKIYFQVPEDWGEITRVYCHVWGYNGEESPSWQSKKEVCTDEGNGLWSYDPVNKGKIAVTDGAWYGVIFSAKNGSTDVNQTYDALFTTECYGETLYCDGTVYENPEDSSKTCIGAFWTNMDPAVYGPILTITSIGNVVGTCCKPGDTPESLFATFLTGKLESARTYSGKDDQAVIDDVVEALGIESDDVVCEIIKASGVEGIAWVGAEGQNPYESAPVEPTPDEATKDEATKDEAAKDEATKDEDTTILFVGDANMDGKVNIKDATHVQKFAAGLIVFSDDEMLCANVKVDAEVNVKDATYIQKWVAKSIEDENMGQPIPVSNFI